MADCFESSVDSNHLIIVMQFYFLRFYSKKKLSTIDETTQNFELFKIDHKKHTQ